MNTPIISKEVESVINKLHTKGSPGPGGFICEFYQTFKEIILTLHKHFQKIEEERIFSNLFYEVSIRWKSKLNKHIGSKENYKPISLINIDTKIFNKILVSLIQQHIKLVIHR